MLFLSHLFLNHLWIPIISRRYMIKFPLEDHSSPVPFQPPTPSQTGCHSTDLSRPFFNNQLLTTLHIVIYHETSLTILLKPLYG